MTKKVKLNSDGSLPPGNYTRENLPPPSPKVKALLKKVKEDAKKLRDSPKWKARRARADEALKKGGFKGRADWIGIMLGAEGYK